MDFVGHSGYGFVHFPTTEEGIASSLRAAKSLQDEDIDGKTFFPHSPSLSFFLSLSLSPFLPLYLSLHSLHQSLYPSTTLTHHVTTTVYASYRIGVNYRCFISHKLRKYLTELNYDLSDIQTQQDPKLIAQEQKVYTIHTIYYTLFTIHNTIHTITH